MRRVRSARRTGLPLAAALLLLPACVGSDEAGPAPEATSRASTTPPAAQPAGSRFCTEAASIRERLEATVTGRSDPGQLPQILDEAASEIRAVEAPEEIAADWTALADGVERFSDAIAGIDFRAPDAQAALEQRLAPLQQELGTASTDVTVYLDEECGVGVSGPGPAAPS